MPATHDGVVAGPTPGVAGSRNVYRRQVGLFNYLCIVPEHIKHILGRLVVLPASLPPVPAVQAEDSI
jgi:hypothetical protein